MWRGFVICLSVNARQSCCRGGSGSLDLRVLSPVFTFLLYFALMCGLATLFTLFTVLTFAVLCSLI